MELTLAGSVVLIAREEGLCFARHVERSRVTGVNGIFNLVDD